MRSALLRYLPLVLLALAWEVVARLGLVSSLALPPLSAVLPLALTIVAARAATRPGVPLAALVDQLWDAPAGLDLFAGPDATTDLRTVFASSYRALSRTSPSSHCPTASFETSAVIVSFWLAPGASVKLDGDTVSVMFLGFVTEALQRVDNARELVTVLVHVQVASHPEDAMLGTFSVVGSPPVVGFAAV